ncbi:unnamed protein product [Caenorhabditis bovis]|uniref:DUF7774 domain-containing protein n=1 Tax=Caenorhabditis bovis TaxID=2654633 RepID=A0A8S1EYK7_9PELO|nr:unnamed protein product [Caenorhabditis bovis]
MLGSNLGKKVTADVVQDQYNQFLKQKTEGKKKTLSAEERKLAKREEMRRRGIFVKADDKDDSPTIIEKSEGDQSFLVYKLPAKPGRWKSARRSEASKNKNKRKKDKRKKEAKGPTKSEQSMKVLKDKSKKTTTSSSAATRTIPSRSTPTTTFTVPQATDTSSRDASVKSEKAKKQASSAEKIEAVPESAGSAESTPSGGQSIATSGESIDTSHRETRAAKRDKNAETPPRDKKIEAVANSGEVVAETPPRDSGMSNKKKKKHESPTVADPLRAIESEQPMSSGGSSAASDKSIAKALTIEKQPDAFDKLDDDEFEAATANAISATSEADEKQILLLAPKLLKVAKKNGSLEKCLTQEQNDALAQFFSGKKPLNSEVLAILDTALDRIIDHMQKNNCEVDAETKNLMMQRGKLKAAMMNEFLVSPQYLPQTWTAKFNKWKEEAEKQKSGINVFRVLFAYPKHKSFDDGPEDNYGNFKRKPRSLWMGLLLGPSDSKSFEETKREEICSGLFLDTKLIEGAQKEPESIKRELSSPQTLFSLEFDGDAEGGELKKDDVGELKPESGWRFDGLRITPRTFVI